MRHTNYNDIAIAYDRRYLEEDYSGIEAALIEFVGDSARVLEVGCRGHLGHRPGAVPILRADP